LNGSNTGNNIATFASSTLNDKDSVRVIMTSNISCVTTPIVSSGKIKMGVSPMVTPSVSLSSNATGNAICKGGTLSVNANITHCGTSASYDWQLNKAMVAGNTPNFSSGSLVNGDKICVMVTSIGKCMVSNKAYSDTITVKVTEVAKPAILLKSSDTLQATVSAETYEWYRNSDLLPASGRVLKLLSSGNYKVVAVQNSCKSEISDAYSYTTTAVEHSKGVELVLFPNPTEGLLQLKLFGVEEDLAMEILNTEGKVILQDQITGKGVFVKTIDLTGGPKGLYLLRLKGMKWVRIMKITVK
jgi:hypothetical protein